MKKANQVKVFEQAAFNRTIIGNLNESTSDNFIPSPDTLKLIPFNGYYAITNAPGAFFFIDANVNVSDGGQTKTYLINFYLSLDGKTSSSYQFSSGTFDGSILRMNDQNIDLNLTFTRLSNQAETASLSGQIKHTLGQTTQVSGATYNNPIERSFFQGTYYSIIKKTGAKPKKHIRVMKIGQNDTLYYDYGTGNEQLKLVESYVYNMNMYYFKFQQGDGEAQLIMGTAGSHGFACNNMVIAGKNVSSRSLQTIINPNNPQINANNNHQSHPNENSKELAAFSGYYQLPSIHPLAFISILGQYTVKDGEENYSATISYSFDGVNSTGYNFVRSGMTFENNVLTMVDASNKPFVNLTFEQEYTVESMMLVKITGSIEQYKSLTAFNPFNPVPLKAFGGVPMTNSTTVINILSNADVAYICATKTVDMNKFTYVPLMYILANPCDNPSTVLSLGTSKGNGNVSIVFDVATNTPSLVKAISNP